jgi:nucleoid-associated protein YgaU
MVSPVTAAPRPAAAAAPAAQRPAAPAAPAAQRPLGAPATVAGPGQRLYTVQAGDTLETIAQRELGDASRWSEIFALNRSTIRDPDLIFVGQVLILPD